MVEKKQWEWENCVFNKNGFCIYIKPCNGVCDDFEFKKFECTQAPTSDTINNPAHYTQGREIEPLNVIEDWELDFYLGNALKYIARAGRKENEIEDLKKAVFYLNRKIDNLGKIKTK